MKINRFLAMTALALLVVGAMGIAASRSYAQSGQPPVPPVQAQECNGQQDQDVAEASQAEIDTDHQDVQCGQQVEDGQTDGAESTAETSEAADSGVQEPAYTGSLTIAQSQTESANEADESAALQSQATITAADAETAALAANPGATVVKTELDNENGSLVYSVELSTGADVKVDAGNGAILSTDSSADYQG